jgi:hypothetical protein
VTSEANRRDASEACVAGASPREAPVIRSLVCAALVAWPTGIALILAENIDQVLRPLIFGTVTSWVVGIGCLGLALGLLRPDDPLRVWERGLNETKRRTWVRALLGHTATASWVLAVAYTVSITVHHYAGPPVITVFTLIYLLALAIVTTIIVLAAPAKSRLERAYVLHRAAHESLLTDIERARAALPHAVDIAMREAPALGANDSGAHPRRLRLLRDRQERAAWEQVAQEPDDGHPDATSM